MSEAIVDNIAERRQPSGGVIMNLKSLERLSRGKWPAETYRFQRASTLSIWVRFSS